ncbi:MAG: thermonuclease family protein [Deltaproteobacteria bacterium]|nr:thermonuclease family protein [Deltaproteobacteria bacterium]
MADAKHQKLSPNYYQKIYQKVSKILNTEDVASQSNYNWVRAQSYWKLGEILDQESKNLDKKEFSRLREKLRKQIQFSDRKMRRVSQFYQTWPQRPPCQSPQEALLWSQYTDLLSLTHTKERNFYYQETLSSGWSCHQLRKAIKQNLYQNRRTLKRFSKSTLGRLRSLINTFWAEVIRVVDGDTLVVRIDLRFGTTTLEELRLRGINCPELHDPSGDGQKAKAFVENELKNAQWVLIVTYKTDKFGRYVADIYYHDVYDTEEDLLAKGKFLNQELLSSGLAKRVEY